MMSEVAKHTYEDTFFDRIDIGVRGSAQHVVGFLHRDLPVSSILDAGCGRGV